MRLPGTSNPLRGSQLEEHGTHNRLELSLGTALLAVARKLAVISERIK